MGSTEEVVAPRAGGLFVGREREIAELTAGLEDARSGKGRLLLLAGEPGIGKSRLADEVAARARERGFTVLWGRCWEAGGAPIYWPWVQAIRTYLREVDATTVRDQLGAGAAEIAQMIPELRELFPDLPRPADADPEGARFRLFDRVATFLHEAAGSRPILLVLDDLQSADTPSLLLLRFVAGVLGEASILALGLYRDNELDSDAPLATAITELRREPAARFLTLGGLEESDVTRFIDQMTDVSPPASLVSAVYHETEGNPLFVGELVRLLAQEGRLAGLEPGARLAIPASVMEVIGRRLEHLSAECRDVLTMASVIGIDFDVGALGRIAEQPIRRMIDDLDEAIRARVVVEVPGAAGRLRFAHALIRETLYEAIPTGNRLELHRRTGEVLESMYGIEDEAYLAELAYHCFAAIPEGDPERAVEYARRAGDVASARLAFEEAARLYGMALQAVRFKATQDDDMRCDLLLSVADAQARAGDVPAAKGTFLAAADLSHRLGRAEDMARAAIGYGGFYTWGRSGDDPHLTPLLERSLQAVGEHASPERVRLLARLACALRDSPDHERSDRLSREAVEIARALGDPATLRYALNGRIGATWWPENTRDRLEVADELLALADQTSDPGSPYQGHLARLMSLLELGEMTRVDAEIAVMGDLAEQLRQPSARWLIPTANTMIALMRGDWGVAAELLAQARSSMPAAISPLDAKSNAAGQEYRLLVETGHREEALQIVRQAAGSLKNYPFFRCALADLLQQAGHDAEARAVYEQLAENGFAALPRDNEWLFALSLVSPVCAGFADKERALILYELQLPFADRHAVGFAEGSAGSVSRALGILATVLGRLDDADGHFRDALEMNERMGARPWVAYTQLDNARMLERRDAPGDRETAVELLLRASATCEELGMVALERRVGEVLSSMGASAGGTPKTIVSGTGSTGTFRREGEYWSIVFGGDAFRLRDSKGLRYLYHLLMAPGREIHALELVSAVEGHRPERPAPSSRGEVTVDVGDAGELLDERAKAEYRTRLLDLEAELSEAEEWNDPERASHLREERDFLARELAAAVGLGGRDRIAASNAERARVNVTRAIRSALDRIQEHSPPLGRHLAATVRTGSFCSYQPDALSTVSWSR
jgi:tetratricopeptide (TPR) repeat protein